MRAGCAEQVRLGSRSLLLSHIRSLLTLDKVSFLFSRTPRAESRRVLQRAQANSVAPDTPLLEFVGDTSADARSVTLLDLAQTHNHAHLAVPRTKYTHTHTHT